MGLEWQNLSELIVINYYLDFLTKFPQLKVTAHLDPVAVPNYEIFFWLGNQCLLHRQAQHRITIAEYLKLKKNLIKLHQIIILSKDKIKKRYFFQSSLQKSGLPLDPWITDPGIILIPQTAIGVLKARTELQAKNDKCIYRSKHIKNLTFILKFFGFLSRQC